MKFRFFEHIAGIFFVTALLSAVLFLVRQEGDKEGSAEEIEIRRLAELPFVDYEDKFHRALFKEALDVYYPGRHTRNKELIRQIDAYRDRQLAHEMQRAHLEKRLSLKVVGQLAIMYFKFILIYIVVMALTYYGVQTLGVWRFVRRRRRAEHGLDKKIASVPVRIRSAIFEITRIISYFILFSPAYVIAYSLRTRFNTDTIPFMIVLAVISNGLLVTYAHRFYTFLISESRKGYIETAKVKNLNTSYAAGRHGINWRQIIAPVKHFEGHVFEHIYSNARFQYFATIKEQASFLITGLIIIEMALNIHGHLSYELLRQMLYRNWEIVISIVIGVFLLVKMTDIFTELVTLREAGKYENR